MTSSEEPRENDTEAAPENTGAGKAPMMHDEEFIPVAVEWTTAVGADGGADGEDSEWDFWEEEEQQEEECGEVNDSVVEEFIDEYRRYLVASEVPEYTPEEIDEQFQRMLSMADSSDSGGPEAVAETSSDDFGVNQDFDLESSLSGPQSVVGRWYLPGAAGRGKVMSSAILAAGSGSRKQDLVAVDGGELARVEAKRWPRRAVGRHDWSLLTSMLVAWADPRGEGVPGFWTQQASTTELFMNRCWCPRQTETPVEDAMASAVARGMPHVLVLVVPDAARRLTSRAALEKWSFDRTEHRSRWRVGWDGDLPELAAAVVLHERSSRPRPGRTTNEVAALMVALPQDLWAAQNISRIQSFVHASIQECLQRIDFSRSP
ncbi:hypothetical protein [Streptomyces subrutilus]|uniref:hypothetical protein n=1 Tax=Streptomyces subrutilus TaxID=36818 RepID=UPI00340CD1BF